MPITRRKARRVLVGSVAVGGDEEIRVESMTRTDTRDAPSTVAQIKALAAAGCEIVRVAVPDMTAASRLRQVRDASPLPVVADIHFDYRLGLAALEAGADGVRINPGNIGGPWRAAEVARAARERGASVRVGVNSGSLERSVLHEHGGPTAQAMVESALRCVRALEKTGFDDIIISAKAPDVRRTVEAYRAIASQVDYPLHVGVTEAGTPWAGAIKSAVGIGALLLEGIGDTLRVSLAGDPIAEVRAGWEILKSLGLRSRGVELIACPTCGRCEIDVVRIAGEVEERLRGIDGPLKVAVMGCAVNGPGEAREADIGIAGGRGGGVLFVRGSVVRRIPEASLVEELVAAARSAVRPLDVEAGRSR